MDKNFKILLVEDELAHTELISRAFALRPEFELVVANSLQTAREELERMRPDLAIVDLLLPDGRGTEFMRDVDRNASLPIIIMTSHGDEQTAVEAIKSGALDYVVKSDVTLLEMPHIAERALREWSHIIERQQIEAELEQYRTQLEDLIAKRTAELEKATEAAQAAYRARSEFLSKMSHELRTPLNGILGYAQILRWDSSLSEEQREMMTVIQESGNHLLTLINDILDLSKIEASRMDLDLMPIYLPNFLHDIAGLVQMQAQHKQIVFHYEPDPSLPPIIVVDEKRLRQILINLLDNAVKFTDEGSVRFRVQPVAAAPPAPEDSPDGQLMIRFEVQDTGIGITPSQIPRIFSPFEQAGGRQHRAEGTGLGLAISRKLVSMMGGDLHVTSAPGQGSTIWFQASFATAVFAEKGEAGATPRVTGYAGPPRLALAIDDKKHNLFVLGDMLESVGLRVVLADSGAEGIAQAQRHQPDIIFLDLIMPGIDGFVTAQKMREIPSLRETPIVAVSASAFAADREKSIEAGCDYFLPKPLDLIALMGALERFLSLEWQYATKGITK